MSNVIYMAEYLEQRESRLGTDFFKEAVSTEAQGVSQPINDSGANDNEDGHGYAVMPLDEYKRQFSSE